MIQVMLKLVSPIGALCGACSWRKEDRSPAVKRLGACAFSCALFDQSMFDDRRCQACLDSELRKRETSAKCADEPVQLIGGVQNVIPWEDK